MSNLIKKFGVFKIKKQKRQIILFIKGTVSVNSSDPPLKVGNVRFTTAPLTALSDQA